MGEVGLFFVLTFVAGGSVSYIVQVLLERLDQKGKNKAVMLVIGILTAVSALSMVVNIGLSYASFGSDYMINIEPICD